MTTINRQSPIPIYHQLKTLIQDQIESGTWQPGDQIPTEHELCQLHSISRSPVRRALNELAQEGMLVRRPGLGTFVSDLSSKHSSETVIKMMCSDARWSSVLDQTTQAWNAEHPEQKISFEVNVVTHHDFYDQLSTAVGGGNAPDVAMVDCVWVAGLAQSGFLHTLEELDPSWNQGAFEEDLCPAFVDANSFAGHLYGLPVKADASLLWYRQDWFAQEGVGPPRDWDDLLELSTHFLQPDVQQRYGLVQPLAFPGGRAAGEATVYALMPFIWSAGGQVFDQERGRIALDVPGTHQALQFLRELVQQHRVSSPDVVSYRDDTSPWMFADGKVAMALGGSYEGDVIRDANGWSRDVFAQRVGCVAPPAAPGGEPVSTVGGTSYVILRQGERPALVMKALRMATDPDVIGDLYRSMSQNLPSLSFEASLGPGADPKLRQTSRMIASGRARPSVPEYFKISRQLQAMFEATLSGTAPVADIVRRTAEFIGVISEKSYMPEEFC